MSLDTSEVRAATKVGPGHTEVVTLPKPTVGNDDALLEVSAAGVCGADVKWYGQTHAAPLILGHEIVGRLVEVSQIASARWGVAEGDLVALEEYLPCGYCDWCRIGEYRHCWAADPTSSQNHRFGGTPIDVAPALWGGYAEMVYLPSNSILHPVPGGVAPKRAAFGLPLGNGFQWSYIDGGVRPGSSVLIQGPGQQGIGCAIAAREAGAHLVIVSGKSDDEPRLSIARQFGAQTVDVDAQDLVATVHELTGGLGVDVAIDTSGGSVATVLNALHSLKRKEGVAVLQPTEIQDFPFDIVNRKAITIRMTRGHSYRAVHMALGLLATARYPFELLNTHVFDLDHVDEAIRTAGGREYGPSLHVVVAPSGAELAALESDRSS